MKITSILLLCCLMSGPLLFTSCSSTKYSSHKSYGYFSNPADDETANLSRQQQEISDQIFEEANPGLTIDNVEEIIINHFSHVDIPGKKPSYMSSSSIPEFLAAPFTKNNKTNRFLQKQIVKKAERTIQQNGIASINQESLMYIGLVLVLVGLIVGLVFNNLGFLLVLIGVILILLHLIKMFE